MEKPTRRNRALDRLPRQPLAGPTLFGGVPTRDHPDDKPVRILAALEHGAGNSTRALRPLKRIMWVGLLFLLGIALVAFGYSGLQRAGTNAKPQPLLAQPAAAKPKQDLPKLAENTAPQTATIEDAKPENVPDPASPFAALDAQPASGTQHKEVEKKSPVAVAAKPKREPLKIALAPAQSVKPQTVAVSSSEKPVAAQKVVSKKVKDADVVLLEALVTHVDAQQRLVNSPSPSRPNAAVQAPDTLVRVANAEDDVVKRCAGLSALEGELCKIKACAGRGDADAACQAASEALTVR